MFSVNTEEVRRVPMEMGGCCSSLKMHPDSFHKQRQNVI